MKITGAEPDNGLAENKTNGTVLFKAFLIAMAGLFAMGCVYYFIANRLETSYYKQVDSVLEYMSKTLSQPIWNLNYNGVKAQAETMLLDDLIISIEIKDDQGMILYSFKRAYNENVLVNTTPILFDDLVVGHLELGFSRKQLAYDLRVTAAFILLFGFAFILFSYWVARLREEIKQRKIYQEALFKTTIKAEAANKSKSIFLANMSHELRTPLNAILGFSQMLERDPNTTESQHEKLKVINRSGEHLLSMINDVLDISRIEAGKVEIEDTAFKLDELLEDIRVIFHYRAINAGLTFRCEIDQGIEKYVSADPGKIRQVLNNLLANAVKHTKSGEVSLSARTIRTPDPDRVELHVTISDTGPGIAKEDHQKIFEPFIQVGAGHTDTKGAGLGLSIIKSFVDLMQGEITLQSELGKGACFRVTLPLKLLSEDRDPGLSEQKKDVLQLEPGQPEWRILVAEDNQDSATLLCDLLKDVGFKVKHARNGKEAVDLYLSWRPHFCWMDMRMPVMDGYQATKKIRSLPGGEEVKIVALTASVFSEQRQEILNAGCDEVMSKPLETQAIFTMLEAQLGIRYIYSNSARSKGVGEGRSLGISFLPEELRVDLLSAARSLSQEEFESTLRDVYEIDAELAEYLKKLSDTFRFDMIIDLLNEKEIEAL